jgi:membrane associated rhomboid family serine protease
LIGANVLIFLLGYVPFGTIEGEAARLGDYLLGYGALRPIGNPFFRPWQYFTYMFLHGGFLHIFLNMLVLWMFGMELAQMWGSKRFLVYYLLCGLGAGIIHSLVTLAIGSAGSTVGASGAIMGVMVAFSMVFPDRIIGIMFIPMRAKYAALVYAGYDLIFGIRGDDGIAHFAHLGGALVGFILLKIGGSLTLDGIFARIPGFKQKSAPRMEAFQPRPQYAPRPKVVDVEYRDVPSERRSGPLNMNFGPDQERIDAILDKISRSGYQNLTEEEKALLVEAGKKMR